MMAQNEVSVQSIEKGAYRSSVKTLAKWKRTNTGRLHGGMIMVSL